MTNSEMNKCTCSCCKAFYIATNEKQPIEISEEMRKLVEANNEVIILDFICRRFPTDSNWTTGNCYHFALILSDLFNGQIYYDVKLGHFLAKIGESYYDYNGMVESEPHYIPWCDFPEYDRLQYARIKRDCIY